MNYLKHVDGLRAFAVLSVLAYHARPHWLPGGFLGVDIFFAISGFVVTGALARHSTEPFARFIAGFYRRRLVRILPALLVMLVLTSVVWVLLIPRSWLSGQAERVALFAFAGMSNWALIHQADAYFAPRAEFSPFTHTWSLGVEEQFYLLAPVLLFLAFRLRRFMTGAIAALAVLSLALAWLWAQTKPTLAFYGIGTRIWELAAGALWYLTLWHGGSQDARVRAPWVLPLAQAAAAGVLVMTVSLAQPGALPVPWALAAVISTLVLVGSARAKHSALHLVLAAHPLRWIGLGSYSVYLWHWPVFVLMRWTFGMEALVNVLVAMVLTFGLAALSYRWVEAPLRSSARWAAMPAWAASATLVSVAAVAAAGSHLMFKNRHHLSLSDVERASLDWYAPHEDPTLPKLTCQEGGLRHTTIGRQLLIEHLPCAKPSTNRRQKELFVLGDSHATAYLPMFHRLSHDESVHVHVYQSPGCPFIDLIAPMGVGRPPECLVDARAAVADVLARALPGDVVMLSSLRLPRFGDQWVALSHEAVLQRHFSPAQVQLRESSMADAESWIKPLLDRRLQVVFAAPLPIFRSPPFRCVDPWTRNNPICAHGLVEARADELAFRAPVMGALHNIAARHEAQGVSVFDPFDALCPAHDCRAIGADQRPRFFDADHLSRWGNEVVYPVFRQHWLLLTQGTE